MKKVTLIICLMLALLSSGCATIMNGSSTQDVFVTSRPSGAIVTTTTSEWIKTPGIFTLPRTKSITLTARLPGYEEAKQEIKSGLSPWIFGNGIGGLCFGTAFNFVPVIVLTIADFSTGSTGVLFPADVHFELVPKEKKLSLIISPSLKPLSLLRTFSH